MQGTCRDDTLPASFPTGRLPAMKPSADGRRTGEFHNYTITHQQGDLSRRIIPMK